MSVTFTNKLDREQHANRTEFVLQDRSGIKHTITFMTACEYWSPVNVTKGATFGPKCLAFQAAAGKPSGLVLVWTPSGFGGGYNIKHQAELTSTPPSLQARLLSWWPGLPLTSRWSAREN